MPPPAPSSLQHEMDSNQKHISLHSSLSITPPPLILHSRYFNFQPYSRGCSLTLKKTFLFSFNPANWRAAHPSLIVLKQLEIRLTFTMTIVGQVVESILLSMNFFFTNGRQLFFLVLQTLDPLLRFFFAKRSDQFSRHFRRFYAFFLFFLSKKDLSIL